MIFILENPLRSCVRYAVYVLHLLTTRTFSTSSSGVGGLLTHHGSASIVTGPTEGGFGTHTLKMVAVLLSLTRHVLRRLQE